MYYNYLYNFLLTAVKRKKLAPPQAKNLPTTLSHGTIGKKYGSGMVRMRHGRARPFRTPLQLGFYQTVLILEVMAFDSYKTNEFDFWLDVFIFQSSIIVVLIFF